MCSPEVTSTLVAVIAAPAGIGQACCTFSITIYTEAWRAMFTSDQSIITVFTPIISKTFQAIPVSIYPKAWRAVYAGWFLVAILTPVVIGALVTIGTAPAGIFQAFYAVPISIRS